MGEQARSDQAETPEAEVIAVNRGDGTWGVFTVRGGSGGHRTKPCERSEGNPTCPWVKRSPIGYFPQEAFIHSANTAYDMSDHSFGCHTSRRSNPLTCAGFLLRGAAHNMAIRMSRIDFDAISDGGYELYSSYREMAEANGVPADHPALRPCRDNSGRDDLNPRNQPRPYTHWALFTSRPKAEACQAELAELGFTVTVDLVEDVIGQKLADTDDERWLLRATRDLTLNDLISGAREVESVVRRHGGRYDGGELASFVHPTDAPPQLQSDTDHSER